MTKIDKSIPAAQAGFCRALNITIQSDPSTRLDQASNILVAKAVHAFWQTFRFSPGQPSAHELDIDPQFKHYFKTQGSEAEVVNANDLCLMMNLVNDYRSWLVEMGLSTDVVCDLLVKACQRVDITTCCSTLFPLAQHMIQDNIDAFSIDLPTQAAKRLMLCIVRCLGRKPTGSTSWARGVRGSCGCRLCSAVNTFLSSSSRSQLQIPASKDNRYHLHRIYTDYGASTGSWSVTTLRDKTPNIWQITTSSSSAQADTARWNYIHKLFAGYMKQLDQFKEAVGALKALLYNNDK